MDAHLRDTWPAQAPNQFLPFRVLQHVPPRSGRSRWLRPARDSAAAAMLPSSQRFARSRTSASRNFRVELSGSNAGLLLRIASACMRKSLTGSTSPSASGVSVILRPTWTRSGSWKASRNRASAPLVADWLKCNRSPARETLFSAKRASRATSKFRSRPPKSMTLMNRPERYIRPSVSIIQDLFRARRRRHRA